MPANSPRKIEETHIRVQIASQIMTMIAAIAVAIWGIYSTNYIKKEREITEYTLKELHQKTTQAPHIQAKVDPTVRPFAGDRNLLEVKITLSNSGNKASKVLLDENALTLVPVEFVNGEPRYQPPINLISGRYVGNLARIPLRFVNVGPGETYEITFVHNIKNPGVYLIHFLALNGIEPSEEERSAAGGLPYKYSVGADQYLIVQ
ncbi:hypothetical protein N5F23_24945 [Pseudomonas sichuanensis]|uniref:hypothetical protein n=1 Tax=Pseudomonas sichuanensis TaxID=2213015 RepID=UPI00215ED06C|nr:hypothetical protein [Pseudomonas sichuanensis]MDH0729228.1 hypothetical protein [Pseudomonas sichuanensis]MDH1585848.1 hypothetical protein [Pseudomonas sichuanensis]MDH1595642.1 hypothetical protein [Pseudomonas sichuanensis]MDH1600914.1 hypothetical protein [Pseudomonas sichuanensis]UVK84843.1 hypothetical protein LOY46_09215 [Pseudomonas sichuanensis]